MKQYLIIGGSSGIGAATADILAHGGARVFATYHTHPQEAREHISWHQLDINLEQPDFSFLPEALDGLLFCPGRIVLKPFARIKPEDFAADFMFQVGGFIKAVQATLPALKASGAGSIVAFSTVAAQRGFAFHSVVAASKGALEGLVRALAAEYAPAIRVNGIAPSITQTPLAASLLNSEEKLAANAQRHPLKTIGRPEDIAQMAAFLLGEQSAWITGQILAVDGGLSRVQA